MTSPQPIIDVSLHADPTCDLSGQSRFSLVVLLTFRGEGSATIVEHDDALNSGLVNILSCGCIECFDILSGETVPVLGSNEDEETSRNKSDNTEKEPLLMKLDSNRASYVTFTSATSPRAYEFLFNTSKLQSNRNYTIRCKPWRLDWWSHDSVEECLDFFKTHGRLPPSQEPTLQCMPSNDTITFDCRENTPKSPRVGVSLAASSILSLSGEPPFRFTTSFTSYAEKPITVLAQRETVVAINSDIEIIDSTTKKRVAPDLIDVNIDGPWRREDFLILKPGEPHVEERSLHFKDGLGDLQVNAEYSLCFPRSCWRWWGYDSVDQAAQWATEGKIRFLDYASAIELVSPDEVKFRVTR